MIDDRELRNGAAQSNLAASDADDHGSAAQSTMPYRLTTSAVVRRVARRFDRGFRDPRNEFSKSLDWVTEAPQLSRYMSCLMVRVVFIYLLAAKDILPGGTRYLRRRLEDSRRGPDRFYQDFFLPFCFFGLGTPQQERGRYRELLEDVPYLGGGLFSPHAAEEQYGITRESVEAGTLQASISIPDGAFRAWFEFLDGWQWSLEEQEPRHGGEMNPRVLDCIFERRVVEDGGERGTYYTQDDVTGYIARNTLIPRLFDLLAAGDDLCRSAVDPLPIGGALAGERREISSGEGIARYVHGTVKHPAPLPRETRREHEARRSHYKSILRDFERGGIRSADDFISYNLDIQRLALDFIHSIEDARVLHRLYSNYLCPMTVLDPACGSGAFLFQVLNTLHLLHEACLERMDAFCRAAGDAGRFVPSRQFKQRWNGASFGSIGDLGSLGPDIIEEFRGTLQSVYESEQEPGYRIDKQIAARNLFGVDLLPEAVEYCRLRLFLKLVAQSTPDPNRENRGLVPLPDLDQNLRVGNSLVGFSTPGKVRKWSETESGLEPETERLLGEQIPRLERYAESSLAGSSELELAALKEEILTAQERLQRSLDVQDAGRRRLDPGQFTKTHRPFHWLIEFPRVVLQQGGFDAVLGNPPYVDYSAVRKEYEVVGYGSPAYGNVYAFFVERALDLLSGGARFGMIVPVSCISGEEYRPLMQALQEHRSWISSYSNRPGKLFEGVEQRLVILLTRLGSQPTLMVAPYQHWYAEERPFLFERVRYCKGSTWSYNRMPLKSGCSEAESIFQKMERQEGRLPVSSVGTARVWLNDAPTYWVRALTFPPGAQNGHWKVLTVSDPREARVVAAVLSSSTFYFFYKMVSNCRDLGEREWSQFPINPLPDERKQQLDEYGRDLEACLREHASSRQREYASGTVEYQEFYPAKAKTIIDRIDVVLGGHYGLNEMELDYLLHYDEKYRLGAHLSRMTPDDSAPRFVSRASQRA